MWPNEVASHEQRLLTYPKSGKHSLLSRCRGGEASIADLEGLALTGSTRQQTGDRPNEVEAWPLDEASKPLPSEPWADLEIGQHGTAGAADQQQQGHGQGMSERRQPHTPLADEAEQVSLPCFQSSGRSHGASEAWLQQAEGSSKGRLVQHSRTGGAPSLVALKTL